MPLGALYQSAQAFQRLLSQPTPLSASRRLIRFRQVIAQEMEAAEEARQGLAARIESGAISEEEANQQFQEMLGEDVFLSGVARIDAEELGAITLSGADLIALDWMLR